MDENIWAGIGDKWFEVQSSKHPTKKSGYEIRMQFLEKGRAIRWYDSLNIGLGYKKRFVECAVGNDQKVTRKVLMRAFS